LDHFVQTSLKLVDALTHRSALILRPLLEVALFSEHKVPLFAGNSVSLLRFTANAFSLFGGSFLLGQKLGSEKLSLLLGGLLSHLGVLAESFALPLGFRCLFEQDFSLTLGFYFAFLCLLLHVGTVCLRPLVRFSAHAHEIIEGSLTHSLLGGWGP
jgi:hypothetical protein